MNIGMIGRGKLAQALKDEIFQKRHSNLLDVYGFDTPIYMRGTKIAQRNPYTDNLRIDEVDIVVHCSNPEDVIDDVQFCVDHNKPVVIATTGWYDQMMYLDKIVIGSKTSVLYSPNFSREVRCFFDIVKYARRKLSELGNDFDIKIDECHSVDKADIPSGTSLRLQKIMKKGAGKDIEISSTRLGKNTFEHTIQAYNENDVFILEHRAYDRGAYAKGILEACEWMLNDRNQEKNGVVYDDSVLYN